MAVKWGIVSCSEIADRFVAPGMREATNAQLAAVVCRDLGRAEEFAAKHGAARAYGNLERLLDDPEVSALYISSPNSLHVAHAIAAAEKGKHVLCEKPMALTVEDCHSMIAAAASNGVKLGLAFQGRFHPAHQEIRRLVATGAVGTPMLAEVQFASQYMPGSWRLDPAKAGAGAIMDMGVHCIDLLRFVLGREVVACGGFIAARKPGLALDNLAVATLKFEGEVAALLSTCSDLAAPGNTIRVYGDGGTVAGFGTVGQHLAGYLESTTGAGKMHREFPVANLYGLEIEAFSRAVEEDQDPPVSGLDGLRATEVALTLLESARTGQTVTLHPEREHA
ncbi:MAG: Gfo/Idh/MocA family protein [Chloroflexota bacterium]